MAAAAIRERWQAWSTRFAALQQREKVMIIGAVVVAIVFGGYTAWVEPGELQTARLKKTLDQQLTEQTQLSTQLVTMTVAQKIDPNAAKREALQALRGQLAGTEQALKAYERALVPPTQAQALLQTLLARHRGLKLLSLSTLPPQPLIDRPADKAAAEKGKPAQPAPPPPGGNLYKHGVEIKVAGSYLDLLAYVADLGAGPQKLLWGDMQLAVREHPVSELTLTVFTLSLEPIWLVV